MPKLQAILGKSTREIVCAQQIIGISITLNMDIITARSLYQNYGNGYIYTQTGLVLLDNPRNKAIVSKKFEASVVVSEYGKVYSLRASKPEQKRPSINPKQVQERYRRITLNKLAEKEREQIFEECKGKPFRKHGGKGDNLDMVGLYKGVPQASIYGLYKPKKK